MAFQLALGCRYGYGYGYGYGKRKCCKDCQLSKCDKCNCQGFTDLDPTLRGIYPNQTIGPYCKAHRKKYTYVADKFPVASSCVHGGGSVLADAYSTTLNLTGFNFTLDLPRKKIDTDVGGGSVCADFCTVGAEIAIGSHTITRTIPWRTVPLGPVVGTRVIQFDVNPVVKCFAAATVFNDNGSTVSYTFPVLGIEWNCSGYSISGDTPPCVPATMDAAAIQSAMNARPSTLGAFTNVETRGFPADEQCCCFYARQNSLSLSDATACRLPDTVEVAALGGSVVMTHSVLGSRSCSFGAIGGVYVLDQASMNACVFRLEGLAPNQSPFATFPWCTLEKFELALGEAGPSGGPFFLRAAAEIIFRAEAGSDGGARFIFQYQHDFPVGPNCPSGAVELPLLNTVIGPWGSNWALTSHTVSAPTIQLVFPSML